ncbi:MAG: flavodoxin family protein [Dehalococcoidales bacterium]|nr:flavodoxin family protein [Dehalococcoidales bacterium]
MKILALVGSPRKNGNTNFLVDQALEEAEKSGADTEKIMLADLSMSPCLGHENCGSFETCLQKDGGTAVLHKFLEADGLILASPVYYYDVTAWMKIFIDRNYFLYRHGLKSKARAAGLIVVAGGTGIEDTVHTLDKLVNASTIISRENRFLLTGIAGRPGEVKNNFGLINAARDLGKNLALNLRK